MTDEQNSLIATRLAGYEIQVSPAGKWYVVTGDETKAMPDWELDSVETLSTVDALCRSRGLCFKVYITCDGRYCAELSDKKCFARTPTSALAHCLLQIAEGE